MHNGCHFCILCIWNEMNVIGISKDVSGSISELLIYCTCQSSTVYNCTVIQLENKQNTLIEHL